MSIFSEVILEIGEEGLEEVRRDLGALVGTLQGKLPELVSQAFRASSEYVALMSGPLRSEFGLHDPAAVESVIAAAASSVNVTFDGELLIVTALASDFTDVLSADGAEYISINSKGGRNPVPWLKWLLFGGTGVVVTGYKLLKKGPFAASRTQDAIMGGRGRYNGGYAVDPQFAGVPSDNWVTRAAILIAEEMLRAIVSEVQR